MTIGFHSTEYNKQEYDEYRNNWVILNLRNQGVSVGVLNRIENGNIVLFPFHTTTYDEKTPIEKVIEEGLPRRVRVSEIVGITPTSKQNAENYCRQENTRYQIKFLNQQRELEGLVEKKDELYSDGAGI